MDPALQDVLRRVERFVAERCVPLEPLLLAHDYAALEDALEEVRADAKADGLWNLALSSDHGGAGLDLEAFGHVSEKLGWSPLGHLATNGQAPDIGNMELLLAHASAEQKGQFLAPLLEGDVRSCFAMTEPEHAGSNPTLMSSTAVLEGGEWVIDGHKWFTTGFDGAAWTIAMVVTDPDADKYVRASMILVPTDTDGVTHVRKLPVMGDEGAGWFSHSEIRFQGTRVPESNLLGPRGGGFLLAQERLGPGRIHHCMRWIGVCERVLSIACERAASRAVSASAVLADQQAVQHAIAESRVEIDAARLLVLEAAHRIEDEGARSARGQISAIKFYVAGTLGRVLDRAVQTLGGLGVLDDTLVAFWYRHERAARIYDGPDEVHKTVVAREELRRYRS
ncbi:acyl-CoA dehydrogenase family protein [Rubrivirga sp.]|uniref:acyl-CoA dehydrogenase family protein n=1 Tax=Rubrivirga sp. TaxID=1885344 RepID=UPI003C71987A